MHVFRPQPKVAIPSAVLPTVDVFTVQPESVRLKILTQGTVQPRVETTLNSEVSGKIIKVSENFKTGALFQKGEVLVQIDPSDYITQLVNVQAELARAELNLAQETAQARQAREDWEALGQAEADPLVRREPQLAEAQATVEAAIAGIKQVEKDLERTAITAPYDGLILNKYVDIGGFLTAGSSSPVADIYAIDYAEVRLPITMRELALLGLPQVFNDNATSKADKPPVTVTADYGEYSYSWQGWIDRAEGAIDTTSRLAHIVARIANPYGKLKQAERPPLRIGQFVEASILGKTVDQAFVIPRSALREGNYVLIADPDDRLYQRAVKVIQSNDETAIVNDGLNTGDRICLDRIAFFIPGMAIQTEEQTSEGETPFTP